MTAVSCISPTKNEVSTNMDITGFICIYITVSNPSSYIVSLIKLIGQRSSKSIFSSKIKAAIKFFGQNVDQNFTVDEDRSMRYSGVLFPCITFCNTRRVKYHLKHCRRLYEIYSLR